MEFFLLGFYLLAFYLSGCVKDCCGVTQSSPTVFFHVKSSGRRSATPLFSSPFSPASFIGEAPIRTNVVRLPAERLTAGPHRLTGYYTVSWLVFIYKAARVSCVQCSTLGIERSVNEAKQAHVLPYLKTPIFYLYYLHRRESNISYGVRQTTDFKNDFFFSPF